MSMIAHQLTRRLQVWRRQRTADGAGGQQTALVQVAAVSARVSQPTARERTVAEQAGTDHDHRVYLLPSADVRRGDELRGTPGEVYRVVSVVRPSRADYQRADCQLVQNEPES